MRKSLLAFCLILIISCTPGKENKTAPQADVPKALQENKESGSLVFSKRGFNDLVEELYKEKLKSSPALQAIEKLIDKLNKAEVDSLVALNDFKTKNEQFYNSGKAHLNSIKDSMLKNEIDRTIERNIRAYTNSISGLNDLITSLNNKSASADDRHTALMVLISLGMMKDYQEAKIPSKQTIESVIRSYDQLIQEMDSVISRNK